MFTWIRNKLDHIRYHSATRPGGKWTRAVDAMPLVALVLAWPTAWLIDAVVVLPRPTEVVSGRLARAGDGSTLGEIVEDPALRMTGISGELICLFTASFETGAAGLPVHSSIVIKPATMVLEVVGEAVPRAQVKYDPGDPMLVAIAETIANDQAPGDIVLDVRQTHTTRRAFAWAWAVNTALLWMILTGLGIVCVRSIRLGTIIAHRQRYYRHKLREQMNKCGHCGYDLTGLEFNERCPECGELVHAPMPLPPHR